MRRRRPLRPPVLRARSRAPARRLFARPERPDQDERARPDVIARPAGRRSMLGDDQRDVMDVLPTNVRAGIAALDSATDLGIGQSLQGLQSAAEGIMDVAAPIVLALVGSDDLAHSPYQDSEWHPNATKLQELAEGATFGQRDEGGLSDWR